MAETATGLRPVGPSLAWHRIYSVLLPIPIACFVGALLTDIAYVNAPDMMWIDFSSWLLLAGLIFGGLAGLVLIIGLVRAGRGWPGTLVAHFGLLLAAWIVEFLNSFVHARDGWTAVVPAGLLLSVLAVILSLAGGWFWQSAAYVRAGEAP